MDEPLTNSTEEQPSMEETPGQRRRRLITLACMLIAAGTVAAVTPDDAALSKPYTYISAALGGLYFVAWSVSFWPQVLLNKQRKTTVGLSPDFAVLNAFAFAAYSAYTVSLYASPQIRHQYKRHHDHAPEVRFADVLFCLHALLLSSVTVGQIAYYDGFAKQAPSRPARYGLAALALYVGGTAVVSHEALQILYALSYCKMAVTVCKYLPQLLLNYRRRSTVGWPVDNILLDFTGGALSTLQLILDCADQHDWSGISGDVVKFGLGVTSMVFDVLFLVQHYVLYRPVPAGTSEALLDGVDEGGEDIVV